MVSRAIMGASFVFGIVCICLPIIAMLIINQEWHFYINTFNVEYKPWRLFVVSCGSLSLLSGLCFTFLPESPKFVFSQGKYEKSLNILRMVYKINTGNPTSHYNVSEIMKDKDVNANERKSDGNFIVKILKLMWNQTMPLFGKSHLKNTLILCSIQFLIFITSSGYVNENQFEISLQ
jgi:hypothetical protein